MFDKLVGFLGKNARSTALGIFMLFGAVGNAGVAVFDSDPATNFDYKATAALVAGGIGLVMMREEKQHEKDNK